MKAVYFQDLLRWWRNSQAILSRWRLVAVAALVGACMVGGYAVPVAADEMGLDYGLAIAEPSSGEQPSKESTGDATASTTPTTALPEPPVLTPPPPRVEQYAPFPAMTLGLAETKTSQWAANEPLFPDTWLDRLGERCEEMRQNSAIPITIGAWHWWHLNTGGPTPSGYGIPTESGTYFYSIEASPEFESPFACFSKCGAYAQLRLRDGGTPFRPYYPNDVVWPYLAYVWAYADPGVLKAGLIWRRFGLDWDGSFWGNSLYYDGFQLSMGWGISWEATPAMEDGFKVDRYYQFFFRDYLDGSFTGADPCSVNGSSERNTGVVRIVPTMQLSETSTLALGVSGMVGQICNKPSLSVVGSEQIAYASHGDQTQAAWALDLTYTRGNFKTFVEGLQAYGTRSPARYVSGGSSNRTTDFLAGFNWTRGPVVYRFTYSLGVDDNPSGTQQLFAPGFTVALTKNVELYTEYIFQEIKHSGDANYTTYENGIQLVLHWQF